MVGAHEAVAPLIQTLNHDTSQIVRKSAIRSLGQLGGPQALQAVERAASNPDIMLANMAQKALEKLKKQ
jgi:HEAT repeat protein